MNEEAEAFFHALRSINIKYLEMYKTALISGKYKNKDNAIAALRKLEERSTVKGINEEELRQFRTLQRLIENYAGRNIPSENATAASNSEEIDSPTSAPSILPSLLPPRTAATTSEIMPRAGAGELPVLSAPPPTSSVAPPISAPPSTAPAPAYISSCPQLYDPCTREPISDISALERRIREIKKAADMTLVGLYGITNSSTIWDFLTTVFINKTISLDDMVSFKISSGNQSGSDIFEVLCRLFVVFGGVADVDPLRGPYKFIRKIERVATPTIYDTVETALKSLTCKATSATGVSDITLIHVGTTGASTVHRESTSYCEGSSSFGVTDVAKTIVMSVKWYKQEKSAEHYDLEKLFTAVEKIIPVDSGKTDIMVFLRSKIDFEIAHNRAYRQYVRALSKYFYGWNEDVKPYLQTVRHTIFEAAEQRGQSPLDILRSLYFIPTAKPVLSLQLHQDIIVEKINNAFEVSEDNRYLVGVLPRGGKTYIAGGIIREYMRRQMSNRKNLSVLWLTAAPTETLSQVGKDLIHQFDDFADFDFIYVKDTGTDTITSSKPHQFIFCSTQLLTQMKAGYAKKREIIERIMTGESQTGMVFYDEAHKTGVGERTKEDIDKIINKYSTTRMPFIFLTATYFNILFEYRISRENTFLWDYTDVLRTRGLGTESDREIAIENLRSRFSPRVVDTIIKRRLDSDDSYDAMAKAYIGFPDLYFISADFQKESLERFASQNTFRPDSGFDLNSIFALRPDSIRSLKSVLTTGNKVRMDAWKVFNNLINPRNIISLLTPSTEGFTDTHEGGTPLTKEAGGGIEPSILGRIHEISHAADSRFRLEENPTLLMFLPTGGEGTSIFHLQCAWASLLKSHPWWGDRYEIACAVDERKLSDTELAEHVATGAPTAVEGIYFISTKESLLAREREAHRIGKGLVILAGEKLSMGVSLPCTDVVFLFNSTKSPDDIIQKMYRSLTPSPGKKAAFVVDLNPVRTLAATYGYLRAATKDSKTPTELLKIIYDTYSWDSDVFEYSLTKGVSARPLRLQDRLRTLFDMAEKDIDAGYRIKEDFKDLEKRLETNLMRGLSRGMIKSLERVFTERPAGTELQIELVDGSVGKVKGGKLVMRVPKEVPPAAGAGTDAPTPAVSYDEIVIENIVEVVADFVKYLAITSSAATLEDAILEYETDEGFKRNVSQLLRTRFTLKEVPLNLLDTILIEATKKIAPYVSEELFKQMRHHVDDTEARRNTVLQMIHARLAPRKTQKVQRGEVFTPIEVINDMLDHLPSDIWKDPTKTWLDPANGIGNFPVVVFQRLDESLSEWEPNDEKRRKHILEKMLYMMEIQPDNSRVARSIFRKMCDGCTINIWTVDTTKVTPDDLSRKGWPTKFDVIMGNPPYNSEGTITGIAFWPKFVDFAFEYIKDGGYISFIHPQGWRKYYNPRERETQGRIWYIIREKGWHLDYVNISDTPPKHFPEVDYYVIHAASSTAKTEYDSLFKGRKDSGKVKLELNFIPNMLNDDVISILNKLLSVDGLPIQILYHRSFTPSKLDKGTTEGISHYHYTTKSGEKIIYKKLLTHTPEDINKNKVIMTYNGGYEKGRLFAFYSDTPMGTTNNSMYMLTTSKAQGEALVRFFNSDVITFLLKITQYSASPNHKNEFKILNNLKMPPSLDDYRFTEREQDLIRSVVSTHRGGDRTRLRITRKRLLRR